MKPLKHWIGGAAAALLLAACGGGDETPRVAFTSMVSFGDSLSDVGTYDVSTIAQVGGGKYNINGVGGSNWTELLALQVGAAAPCAAQTGLNSIIPGIPAVPEANHANCFNYAQGGARVTNPVGPQNIATLPAAADGALGQLTKPLVEQINRHLGASGGSFRGTELVTLLAGGNDVFMNLGAVGAGLMTPTDAVTAMGLAGAELAGYINTLIVGRAARYVVVVNLPDMSQTPFGYSVDVATRGLINTMVTTYNAQLAAGLASTQGVLLVDAYTQGQHQTANPAQYGVTNNTVPACDLMLLAQTIFASSLVCTTQTLIAGDVSGYQFADAVHPSPLGYRLLAQFVAARMVQAGWL